MNRIGRGGSHVGLYEAAKAAVKLSGSQTTEKGQVRDEGASVWGDVATMSLAVVMSRRRPNIASRSADRTLTRGVAARDGCQPTEVEGRPWVDDSMI